MKLGAQPDDTNRRCVPAALLVLCALLSVDSPASAELFKIGPVGIGGAVRHNFSVKTWERQGRQLGELDVDVIRADLSLKTGKLIGSAQFRYYIYEKLAREAAFLHHAWIGYTFTDSDQVQLGVHQVPFGILPYASHNWFFQLPYYLGFEDDNDLGIKYIWSQGAWNWQLAYYVMDEGQGLGKSEDSARYSYDVVNESGLSANEERHQFNGRVAHTFTHAEALLTELGLSVQYGLIPNEITNGTGSNYAVAAHLNGRYGRWGVKLETLRYDYDLENPRGEDDRIVVLGAYDFPYNVAAEGTILAAGISYRLPIEWMLVTAITFYNDASMLVKDEDEFRNTFQEVVGMSIHAAPFLIYLDVASGLHHPWLGPSFLDGLAAGDQNKNWHTRFNANVGLYF